MEVAGFVQLAADVALSYLGVKVAQLPPRKVARDQSVQNRFGRKHSRLYRKMYSLSPLAIEHRRGVADYHHSVVCQLGPRIPSANRHRLRAVANQLAAF